MIESDRNALLQSGFKVALEYGHLSGNSISAISSLVQVVQLDLHRVQMYSIILIFHHLLPEFVTSSVCCLDNKGDRSDLLGF